MSGEPYRLPQAVLDEIYAHAVKGYPEEVCGFVLGTASGALEARPCENRQNALHAEDPAHFPRDARSAYNLGPKDLFFLDSSLRKARKAADPASEPSVRVIYHSHVEVGAYFSAEDKIAAAPDGELLYPVDYLVVDVRKDGARDAKLFRFTDGSFVEIPFVR